jgi:hypothetical protein
LSQSLVLWQQFLVACGYLPITVQALLSIIQSRLPGCVGVPDRTCSQAQNHYHREYENCDGRLPLLLLVEIGDHGASLPTMSADK